MKLKTTFNVRKYSLQFVLLNVKNKKSIDLLFFISFGGGRLIDRLEGRGIWFYIDLLQFKIKDFHKAKGFTIKL